MMEQVSWPRRLAIFRSLSLLLAGPGTALGASVGFRDPLDHPARIVTNASARPLMGVAAAGDRLIAVGSRGLVIVSTDAGRNWRQAEVPVQSDLLAVHFPAPLLGWAVGHDGLVLHSKDGGASWGTQLDGRRSADSFRRFYEGRAARGDQRAHQALRLVDRNYRSGATLPYLDVWFADAMRGFAVGSYGMVIATLDGGQTWDPWMDRIDSGQLNLNFVRGIHGEVFIGGEQGKLYKLDRAEGRFSTIDTGYTGSFFGLAGNRSTLVAFGLRGVTYRSDDQGGRWQQLGMAAASTISAGAVRNEDGAFILVNGAGDLLIGDAGAREFKVFQPKNRMRLTGVLPRHDGSIVLTGLGGVATECPPSPTEHGFVRQQR